MFILPKSQSINAYNLITGQVKKKSPLNLGLVFNKYVNKFVTGYEEEKWNEGKQSEIKRQIYLLGREREEVLEKLKGLGSRDIRKIMALLEECDIEAAITEINKSIRNMRRSRGPTEVKRDLERCLNDLQKIKLALPSCLIDDSLYALFHERMEFLLSNLKGQKYFVESEIFQLNWRLTINLGTASVYETSLLFHRNYSVPYIPGSAVKGVTRHWAILRFAEETGEDLKKIDEALSRGKRMEISVEVISFADLAKIFGSQGRKGEVIFFDALPIINQKDDFVVLDIMNVHYKPYYERGEAPGDWHDPTPVFFLAVEKGTKFKFALASKNRTLVKKARNLLIEALENMGIGAKTSAGYGFFNKGGGAL